MNKIIILLLLTLPFTAFSQTDTLTRFINPQGAPPARGYSHAVKVDLGTCYMLLLSGQIALDGKGELIGKNDLGKQTEQVFRNIKTIVEAARGTMDHIVKIAVYMTDVNQVQAFRDARNKFINTQQPPASTLVQVSKLVRDDLLIEIEATVIIPKQK
jgi:reactive intermediate/imine deaminase